MSQANKQAWYLPKKKKDVKWYSGKNGNPEQANATLLRKIDFLTTEVFTQCWSICFIKWTASVKSQGGLQYNHSNRCWHLTLSICYPDHSPSKNRKIEKCIDRMDFINNFPLSSCRRHILFISVWNCFLNIVYIRPQNKSSFEDTAG